MQNETIEGLRLSPQQKRLWSLQKACLVYRTQCAILVEGKLNAKVLQAALQKDEAQTILASQEQLIEAGGSNE